jgi:hypothetical protein
MREQGFSGRPVPAVPVMRLLVIGYWLLVIGLWFMVYGLWFMVYGEIQL